jgi:ATP-dependent DNA helicase PIF1
MAQRRRPQTWRAFWESLLNTTTLLQSPHVVPPRPAHDALPKSQIKDADFVTAWQRDHGAGCPNTWTVADHGLQTWLQYCAWGQCPRCLTMYTRSLTQSELLDSETARPRLSQACWGCATHSCEQGATAQLQYPPELQGLTAEVHLALRVLVLHQGTPKKHPHGYIRKDQFSGLSWVPQPVLQTLTALPARVRGEALQAYHWLMAHSSVYKAWVRARQRLPAAEPLRLQPSSLLQPYVEAGLWPHLYISQELCESHCADLVQWHPLRPVWSSTRSAQHRSAKAEFVSKVLGHIVDWKVSYPMLQFQFDRYVFQQTMTRHHIAAEHDMDAGHAFENKHWTPAYWRRHHAVLQDICDQLGPPSLFFTIAPWEWDFPFPYWLQKARTMSQASTHTCAAAETLCIAHALHQLVAGMMAGYTGGQKWKLHMLANKSSGEHNVQAYFARFEYQDGGKMHEYGKGRGSLHVHSLFWLTSAKAAMLHHVLAAELPPHDAPLAAVISRVQSSDQCSRVPVRESCSTWWFNAAAKRWELLLKHPLAFASAGLRPYLTSILRVFRCSQDVQWWHGHAALLQYVSGYVSKFAESWNEEWLERDSALQAGLAVVRNWKAGAPEQAMTLARMHMAFTNAKAVHFKPPGPQTPDVPALYLYRRRLPEEGPWNLLKWLRHYLIQGSLVDRTLRTKRRKANVLVAVGVLYSPMHRDLFFWQWMLMHLPHRQLADLMPACMEKVSAHLRYFAAALHLRPEVWADEVVLRKMLELCGHKSAHIETCLHQLGAARHTVEQQWLGLLPRHVLPLAQSSMLHTLNAQQQHFCSLVLRELQWRRAAEDPLDIGAPTASWRPHFLTGGPGCGKSHTMKHLIPALIARECRVLVASPTGMLASSVAAQPGMSSQTINKAFGIAVSGDTTYPQDLEHYDVWIIGELGMTSCSHFDHIIRCWLNLGKQPVLVFEGDFGQLPPVHGDDAQKSRFWKLLSRYKLNNGTYRTSDHALLEFQRVIRERAPTASQLYSFTRACGGVHELTAENVARCLAELPNALLLCAYRSTTAWSNAVAMELCHGEPRPCVRIWSSESTVEDLPLKLGCRLMITRNSDITAGFINGVFAQLVDVAPAGLLLRMPSGDIQCLPRRAAWVQAPHATWLQHAFDINLGYAVTVHKAEGQTLAQVILVLEGCRVPGWAYTAITRATSLAGVRLFGDAVPEDFVARATQ